MKLKDRIESLENNMHKPQADNQDFELEPCSGPLWDTVGFLETRKLGPAGNSLLNALTGYRRLTEAQEDLLQKVLAKMCHLEWQQPIQQELEKSLQALAACNRESRSSALGMI